MMTPVGMAMLYRVYPPHERIVVARRLMIATILAPATGPVLGGLLLTLLSWRFVFLVNVPVGLAALLFGLLFVRDRPQPAPGAFDVPGILLAGIGFGGVMFALSEGPTVGWSNPAIAIAAGLGIGLLAALVAVELRTAEPLLKLRLLQNRLFRTVNTAALLSSTAFLGVLYLFTLYIQDALGASPLVAGLTTFPEALGVVVSAQVVSRIYPWIGPRRMLSFGLLLVSIWIGAMALTGPGTNLWVLRGIMLLLGASIANVFVPSQAAAFATITKEDTGRASTLFNSQRQIGAALGVAVLGTTLGILGPTEHTGHGVSPHLLAYHVAFVVAAAIALLGAVAAQLIPDRDAAPTLRRRPTEASEAEV
jgi:MFS family permease